MSKEKEKESLKKDMTPILLKDLGTRFATEKSKEKRRYGLYQCQYCSREFECICKNIKNGNTKSCGCQSQGHRNPHGLGHHPLYQTWKGMRARCYNKNNKAYLYYGGRGIRVCDRWLDVANFIEDMYPSFEEGLTLDRIENNGIYEPANCRWADKETQAQNTKDIRSNNNSGYRGVSWSKRDNKWVVQIKVNNKQIRLGIYPTALEAAKAYETYVRLNNLEHNFTPVLSEEEIEELNIQKEENVKI